MGLFSYNPQVRVVQVMDLVVPCIRSFYLHQVASRSFDPFPELGRVTDFVACFQLERMEVSSAGNSMSPVLDEVILVHNQHKGLRCILNGSNRPPEVAKSDPRFRAAALLGCCWTEAPGDSEAMQYLLLYLKANMPEVPPVFFADWPVEGWKIHSPVVDLACTDSWFV